MSLKLHGLPMSGNCTPIFALCIENGIELEQVFCKTWEGDNTTPEFKAKNPMHCIPTLEDGDFAMWECRAILRYIANKHKLESWYPTDPKKRALVDMALDWNMSAMNPVRTKMIYGVYGWAPVPSADELAAAEKKWADDLEPAFAHMIKMGGGPLIGGAKPCLADVAILGYMILVVTTLPNGVVAKSKVVQDYMSALKAALPKYDEYMAAPIGFAKEKEQK